MFSLLVTLALTSPAAPTYFAGTGHYYDFVAGFQDWSSANTAASTSSYLGLPGHLATIADANENAFLAATFSNSGWLGLVKSPTETDPASGWSWVTQEAFSYSNWQPSEPNNNTSQGPENRGEFYVDGTWNDLNENPIGNGINGYFVEFEAIPEPTTMTLVTLCTSAILLNRRRYRFSTGAH